MDIEVKLYPHIGLKRVQVGTKFVDLQIDHKQMWVVANGEQVALYCGTDKEPGKYLSFIKPLPEAIQKAVAEKVAALTGGVSHFNAPPPEDHEDAE